MPISIVTNIAEYSNELAELVRAFFPGVLVTKVDTLSSNIGQGELVLCSHYKLYGEEMEIITGYHKDEQEPYTKTQRFPVKKGSDREKKRAAKNHMKRSLYDLLEHLTNNKLEWGALTGIRPTKIVHGLMNQGWDGVHIPHILYEEYRVHPMKSQLLLDIVQVQRPYIRENHDRKISIYVNIPLCTTKCLFCSFPSDTIDRCGSLVDEYISALVLEMSKLEEVAMEYNLELETIYIGGGTPTSLNLIQLDQLLKAIDQIWGKYRPKEYTVEGGRPDSMDRDKLELIKSCGVSRISINPQTMNERTLRIIGRNHTPDEIARCFHISREVGFTNINMDVIVGLPGEGKEDAVNTMDYIRRLGPDSLTVHTLAIKRASPLKDELQQHILPDSKTASNMMEIFHREAIEMGMMPYYLYRQKYMLGNMENVGFAYPQKECVYNIQIMEDKQSIWAFGAGAITKLYYPHQDRIERIANVKNIGEYIRRVDEMVERKMIAIQTEG